MPSLRGSVGSSSLRAGTCPAACWLTELAVSLYRASAADDYAKRLNKLSKHHFGTGETG